MTIRISKIVTVIAMLTLSMIKKEYDSKEEGKWKVVERVRERSRHGEHERQTHTITVTIFDILIVTINLPKKFNLNP